MKNSIKILLLFLTLNFLSCKENYKVSENNKAVNKIENPQVKNSIFPKPIGYVNDYGNVFAESQQVNLSKKLTNYKTKTTREIVIVTVDSIKPYNDLHKYATDLGNTWGVGTAEKNNGLVIVLCKPCQGITIATGLGTEKILTDEICKEVIDKTIIPEFKKGDFYNGIYNGVNELIKKWE